jgi:hypothetical protein
MPTPETELDAVRTALQRLGLDPNGVDLVGLAWVKHDTEQRIIEHRRSAEFAAILALAAEPPSD